jgi:CO dehydrogenase nickel-insertion accessory protein CooC1
MAEPSFIALSVADEAARLAREPGIRKCFLVVNRIRNDAEEPKAPGIIGPSHPFDSILLLAG